jgi:hypothetical protein
VLTEQFDLVFPPGTQFLPLYPDASRG